MIMPLWCSGRSISLGLAVSRGAARGGVPVVAFVAAAAIFGLPDADRARVARSFLLDDRGRVRDRRAAPREVVAHELPRESPDRGARASRHADRSQEPARVRRAARRPVGARRRRAHRPLAILMVDIDHFKAYNDSLRAPGRRPNAAPGRADAPGLRLAAARRARALRRRGVRGDLVRRRFGATPRVLPSGCGARWATLAIEPRRPAVGRIGHDQHRRRRGPAEPGAPLARRAAARRSGALRGEGARPQPRRAARRRRRTGCSSRASSRSTRSRAGTEQPARHAGSLRLRFARPRRPCSTCSPSRATPSTSSDSPRRRCSRRRRGSCTCRCRASPSRSRRPGGRPSAGRYMNVTVAPGLNVSPVMPRWISPVGAEPSKLQSVSRAVRVLDVQVQPRVRVVERPAHDGAGFDHLRLSSNIANEWCALHGRRREQRDQRPRPAVSNSLFISPLL